ncbi:glycoside hydrolase family 97 protein [Colwellia sp. 1_MG-2023]|uniref:glycoside hydrolase family 97 protein n=1 Tax=Colwellia sp. 1_MG-2023 TaxID=3062649 RepID=UPI0026E1E3F3|nr:glycoside hydrolase family 97 protein [Colwellia sp. 1_MG-2023]MDO6447040.1 glycoside hydrolase family 97 protein [Colwellia sp. 1_MG-2023]
MFTALQRMLVTVCFFMGFAHADSYQLSSPDGKLALIVNIKQKISYSLSLNKTPIINDSFAELNFRNDDLTTKLAVVSLDRNTVNRVLTPHVKQKSQKITEHYNEIVLRLNDKKSITFRLYNQGLAYRFSTTKSGVIEVTNEVVAVNFAKNHQVLFPEETSFISHNERLYLPKQLQDISDEQFASLPLLVDAEIAKVVFTETALRDYPGMWIKGSNDNALHGTFPKSVLQSEPKKGSDRNEKIISRANYLAKSQLKNGRDFPWRVFAVGQNDADLLTNQLSYLLADELAIDPSWIKPGKVAWDWWNANNLYNVNFKAGINTQTYKYYIDFAAKYGLEYIILDEGWHHLDDVLNIKNEIDVKEIIAYGKTKNVEVILWVIWKTLENNLDHALDEFAKWGAAGIKVDFMQRDDQTMVQYYWKVAEKAAKHKLLVNFHGSYKPAGLRRTFPNVITREGVRGLEHNKWADYITAEHNLTLPFIRQLAGPMDYTPGAMINSQPENFRIIFNRPMSKTTRVHQMAMYVIFESPLQMLADSPSNYLKEHETTNFISKIPTVWDETSVLSAKLSDHIIIARRLNDEWFIGVMGNGQEREFSITLSFLSHSDYQMESFADGINADTFASDYQTKTQLVNSKSKIKIKLAPNGGWVARLTKQD